MRILDGTGGGYQAKVTNDNKLSVHAESFSIQAHASIAHKRAFQVHSGEITVSPAGTEGLLQLRNDNTDKTVVITYIRIGCDETETASAKVEITSGGTWVNGSAVTPVNMNFTSSRTSGVTVHKSAVTTGSTLIDMRYISGPGEVTYNKEGAVVLPPGAILNIKITTQQDNVNVYGRCSFIILTDEDVEALG